MLRPSMTRPSVRAAPASSAKVGSTSIVAATSAHSRPAGTLPGHRAMHGTRIPPSNVVNFPSRRGPAEPPALPLESQGPLSEVKTTRVCSSTPCSRSAARIRPTDQSISSIVSPYSPRLLLPRNAGDANNGMWGIVCGTYRKNGRARFRRMKSTASSVYRLVRVA